MKLVLNVLRGSAVVCLMAACGVSASDRASVGSGQTYVRLADADVPTPIPSASPSPTETGNPTAGPTPTPTPSVTPSPTPTYSGPSLYRFTVTHSGKVLDVPGGDRSDGIGLRQWTDVGIASQRWTLNDVGGGAWEIRSANSQKCVTVRSNRVEPGVEIEQYVCVPNAGNQRWYLDHNADGSFAIRSVSSNLCIDITNSSQDDGAWAIQYTCAGSANQRWRIDKTSP